ncbi:tetratricopeptide repeat protein [Pseudorhodoferax soli]|uniref:Tetratricopeptide repeat protein n=2 Tax=Pseudorhodoferax soli TaxID=545864 RepID=A0A368XTV7_9BURK|nr:tetratricopeptide repeat protein [Pseudorhodoferax soli]
MNHVLNSAQNPITAALFVAIRKAVLLSCAAFALSAAAQPDDSVLAQAHRLMAENQAEAAYRLLEPWELERADDAPFSYLFGIAALDAGHATRAIFALERAVAVAPDDNLARAELARAYLLAGEPDRARTELQAARRGEMPLEAAAAIDRVLGGLDVAPASTSSAAWRAYFEGVVGHDSNVNSATAAGQFALPAFGGIVFNLDRENRKRGDAFAGLGAGAAWRKPLSPAWELEAAANLRGTFHRNVHAMNNRQYDGSFGASYTSGVDRFSAALQTLQYDIDDRGYRSASGLSAQWQRTLDGRSQLSAFTQLSRLRYAQDRARDADRAVLGAGFARALSDAQLVYASVYGAKEKPRLDGVANYGHHAAGVRLGGERALDETIVAFAAVQYEKRRYGGAEPFFDTRRVDRQLDASLGVHITPSAPWRLSPQVSYVRADSSVVLYDYRRVVWQFAVRREFN